MRVRQGKLQDLVQIKQFTQHTFRWGDYLAGAWESWVRSKRGTLLVAEIDSVIVGTIHVRYLEHKEAWLEGVRVRHEYRRRGIAGILIQAAHASARAHRCRVIRLETGAHNLAAQRTFEKFGYQRLCSFAVYKSASISGEPVSPPHKNTANIDTCWDLWQHSSVRQSTRGVIPAPYGWRWWELTRKRLGDESRAGRFIMVNRAFALMRSEEDGLDITLIVGAKRGAIDLLHTARIRAHQDQKPHVYWIAPATQRSGDWAATAAYTLDDDGLLIYECHL